jgi:transcriptional regulator with XRE-family HTH domain
MHHTDRRSLRPFGELIGVSHTKVAEWKNGESPMPEERIRQIAKLANQDPGPWLLLIKSEQEGGELGREWAKLAKRLAATAALLAVVIFPALPSHAQAAREAVSAAQGIHYAKLQVVRSLPGLVASCPLC